MDAGTKDNPTGMAAAILDAVHSETSPISPDHWTMMRDVLPTQMETARVKELKVGAGQLRELKS